MKSVKQQLAQSAIKIIPKKYLNKFSELFAANASGKLDYDKYDIVMYRGIRQGQCESEPELIGWIENEFKGGDVFYDIGASVGPFAIIAGKYHKGDVKVYAFEPAFINIPDLVQNIVRNDCENCVFPFVAPLSDKTGLTEFNYHSLKSGRGYHTLGEPKEQSQHTGKKYSPAFKQIVMSFTIDELVEKYNLPAPNHIKLDVDGIELQILRGANSTLRKGGVKSVMVEIADDVADRLITSYLKDCGYKTIIDYRHDNTSNRLFKL